MVQPRFAANARLELKLAPASVVLGDRAALTQVLMSQTPAWEWMPRGCSGHAGRGRAEVVRRVRAEGIQVPIVIASGHMDSALEKRLARGSFHGFLLEPFSMAELLTTIEAALSSGPKAKLETRASERCSQTFDVIVVARLEHERDADARNVRWREVAIVIDPYQVCLGGRHE